MATISKNDLMKELAEKSSLGQKDVKTLTKGLLESITHHLKQDDKVQLTGFGSFEVRGRKAVPGLGRRLPTPPWI